MNEPAHNLEIVRSVCEGCGSLSVGEWLTKFNLRMSRCNDCGLLFTNPCPPTEAISARYSQRWFETEYLPSYGIDPLKPAVDHLAARFGDELDPLERFRQVNRILDVGAGAGLFLTQARGWEVAGVELSDFGPAFAGRHFGIEIRKGTLDSVRFDSDFFDVVMLQDTIEHLSNPASVLKEINRILRTGGALVLSTPNFGSLGRRILATQWALISPMEHLCLFDKRSLEAILRNTGFSVENLHSNGGIEFTLFHDDGSTGLKWRRRIIKWLAHVIPGRVVQALGIGDELHCIAAKRVHSSNPHSMQCLRRKAGDSQK